MNAHRNPCPVCQGRRKVTLRLMHPMKIVPVDADKGYCGQTLYDHPPLDAAAFKAAKV